MSAGSRSEMAAAKRVLITGMGGFTGRYMAEECAHAGYDVFGVGSGASMDCEFPYWNVDLDDLDGLAEVAAEARPDYVVHLAALAFVGPQNSADFYRVNLIGTRNLLEALSHVSPEKVLLASSAYVYGNAIEGPISESTPLNPANDYAVSKVGMEYMAKLWLDKLPVLIVRPFNYTGVGQSEDFVLPKIVSHFRRGAETIELGNLDVWRDFGDVRFVVNAYRKLLETAPSGVTVNICSGMTHSLREVTAICERITGRAIQVKVNPAFMREHEVRSLWGDPGLLKQLIGHWEPPPLEETLRWMMSVPK